MSMREFKIAEHKREIEEAAQRAHDARVKELAIHPLVKAGCDRNVREAYFYGLAYAAICNDDRIDDVERDLLKSIGDALAIDPVLVSDVMQWTVEEDDAKRKAMSLFAEVLSALHNLPSVWMPRLFAAEFARIRLVSPERDIDLAADFKDIGDGCGVSLVDDIDEIVAVIKGGAMTSMESVDLLAVLLGDEVVKYFVLRDMDLVDEPLSKWRALPDCLVSIVESNDTWPVEFSPDDCKPLFDEARIAESDVGTFVAINLLPHMKRACEAAREQIGNVAIVGYDGYHGAKFESNREFRILFRYAFFIDAFVDLNDIDDSFYFVGPVGEDSSYFFPVRRSCSDITAKRIGSERFEKYGFTVDFREPFDRLRCHWYIYDDESKRYFAQWEGLFAAIENRFVVKETS